MSDNLIGFFKENQSGFKKFNHVKKPKKKKAARNRENYRKRRQLVLDFFKLNEYATNAGVCLCIHKETNWAMPGTVKGYRRYIAKFSRQLNRRPELPKRKQAKFIKDFYNSPQWKELRYTALRLSEGKCNLCGATAHDGVTLHADHIIPRSIRPDLQLDLDNIQIMCSDCNIGKKNYDDYDFRNKF